MLKKTIETIQETERQAEALVKEAAGEKARLLEEVRKRRPEFESAGDREAASEINKLVGAFDARRQQELEGLKTGLDERRTELSRHFEANRKAALDCLLKVLTTRPRK
ncbi:MAG TPA: hypothetical protein PKN80_08610 [bacterium]|nr:hypothetical protein [bacterium]